MPSMRRTDQQQTTTDAVPPLHPSPVPAHQPRSRYLGTARQVTTPLHSWSSHPAIVTSGSKDKPCDFRAACLAAGLAV